MSHLLKYRINEWVSCIRLDSIWDKKTEGLFSHGELKSVVKVWFTTFFPKLIYLLLLTSISSIYNVLLWQIVEYMGVSIVKCDLNGSCNNLTTWFSFSYLVELIKVRKNSWIIWNFSPTVEHLSPTPPFWLGKNDSILFEENVRVEMYPSSKI